MNTFDQLFRSCTADPDDDTAARALVDFMQEEQNAGPWEARRAVGAIRRAARHARELDRARALLRVDALGHIDVREHIRAAVALDLNATLSIYIVSGSRPPMRPTARFHGRVEYWPADSVVVGARWILRAHEELREADYQKFLAWSARMNHTGAQK